MYPRTEYEMTDADLNEILAACRSVPAMMIGGMVPASPQENANQAWERLGKKMGFDYQTVRPVPSKGQRFFSAIPSETMEAHKERLAAEAHQAKQNELTNLENEISEKTKRADALRAELSAIREE